MQLSGRPPIVLVHGAANSAVVWTFWQQELTTLGWAPHAVDLRGHGQNPRLDLSRTSIHDYADDVYAAVRHFSRSPVLIGWSMGGLVSMMVASSGGAAACVALANSRLRNMGSRAPTLRTNPVCLTSISRSERSLCPRSAENHVWPEMNGGAGLSSRQCPVRCL